MEKDWRSDLERWLAPFTEALSHKTRARICPAYVAGLIGPGDRKSLQPMAMRDGAVSYNQLHHFIADSAWDAAPLESALLAQADRMVGGEDAWLIVDDTALPKKGRALGRGRAAIRFGLGQERQLSDAGVADACVGRGSGHGGPPAVPA